METRFRLSDLSTLAGWRFVFPQSSLPRANAPAPPAIRVKKSRRIILPPLERPNQQGAEKSHSRVILSVHNRKRLSVMLEHRRKTQTAILLKTREFLSDVGERSRQAT
jgi:hypothetical protein